MSQPTGNESATDKTTTDANANAGGSGNDSAKDAGKDTKVDTTGDDTKGLKSALQKERKAREDLERQLREQELAKLPELERFKSEADRLTKENEKLTIENQRMRIGMELGLKWSVAKRIAGDTEAEMRADAAELLRSLRNEDDEEKERKTNKDRDAVNKAKTNDAHKTGPAGKPDMNSLLRIAAGRSAR